MGWIVCVCVCVCVLFLLMIPWFPFIHWLMMQICEIQEWIGNCWSGGCGTNWFRFASTIIGQFDHSSKYPFACTEGCTCCNSIPATTTTTAYFFLSSVKQKTFCSLGFIDFFQVSSTSWVPEWVFSRSRISQSRMNFLEFWNMIKNAFFPSSRTWSQVELFWVLQLDQERIFQVPETWSRFFWVPRSWSRGFWSWV